MYENNSTGQSVNTTMATIVYALQAVSLVLGITAIVAVVLNYVTREDVRGTWLDSHYRWQINTFWFSLLWALLGLLTAFIFVGYFILVTNLVWFIYRFIKGWVRLADGRPMYL